MIVLGLPCSQAKAACTGRWLASAVTREKAEMVGVSDMEWLQRSRLAPMQIAWNPGDRRNLLTR
jgi:hypothetical protein